MNNYIIYSDGSLKGNYATREEKPLRGGWSSIICDNNNNIIVELFGGNLKTSAPRMELTGVIEGLKWIQKPSNITVISDSQYVVNGINDNWLLNILQNPEDFSNVDLWVRLAELLVFHNVTMVWTKGHADNEMNNKADKLAQFAAKMLNLPEDEYCNSSKETRESLVSKLKARRSNGSNTGCENGEIMYSLG